MPEGCSNPWLHTGDRTQHTGYSTPARVQKRMQPTTEVSAIVDSYARWGSGPWPELATFEIRHRWCGHLAHPNTAVVLMHCSCNSIARHTAREHAVLIVYASTQQYSQAHCKGARSVNSICKHTEHRTRVGPKALQAYDSAAKNQMLQEIKLL